MEFYELIARDAQALIRWALEKGFSLKTADAIHIATADRLGAKEFHTYDEKLYKFSKQTPGGFEIIPPLAKTPLLILSTPNALTEPTSCEPVSIETEQPASQSDGDGKETTEQPEPSPPSVLPVSQAPQQPDSSPPQSQLAQSEPPAD